MISIACNSMPRRDRAPHLLVHPPRRSGGPRGPGSCSAHVLAPTAWCSVDASPKSPRRTEQTPSSVPGSHTHKGTASRGKPFLPSNPSHTLLSKVLSHLSSCSLLANTHRAEGTCDLHRADCDTEETGFVLRAQTWTRRSVRGDACLPGLPPLRPALTHIRGVCELGAGTRRSTRGPVSSLTQSGTWFLSGSGPGGSIHVLPRQGEVQTWDRVVKGFEREARG